MVTSTRRGKSLMIVAQPNCTASWRSNQLVLLALAVPSLTIATAFALRIGASITAPQEGLTVGEGMLAATADFAKVFLFLVVPLLLVAAFVEANITTQIVLWAYGA